MRDETDLSWLGEDVVLQHFSLLSLALLYKDLQSDLSVQEEKVPHVGELTVCSEWNH